MRFRNLIGLLFLAAMIYFLFRLFRPDPDLAIRSDLIQLDTSRVSHINIQPPLRQPLTLSREADGWMLSDDQRSLPVSADNYLQPMAQLDIRTVVGRTKEQWADYGLNDGRGIRVQVYDGDQLMESFYISQLPDGERGVSEAYIRLARGEEVYSIDGSRIKAFRQDLDSFRDLQLLYLPDSGGIQTLTRWDTSRQQLLHRDTIGWKLDNVYVVDDRAVLSYVAGLSHLRAVGFADDFDEVAQQEAFSSLQIEGPGIRPPLSLALYIDSSARGERYIVHSSQHRDTYFLADSALIHQHLFPDWGYLNDPVPAGQ